jgi:cytochrome P450
MGKCHPLRGASGPVGYEALQLAVSLMRNPLSAHIKMAAKYGDAVRLPIGHKKNLFLFSAPVYAEHVLAARQDNYVKCISYRPLQDIIGNGLLTKEGEDWRLRRRLLQPLFTRQEVSIHGEVMSYATQRLVNTWDELPNGSRIDIASPIHGLTLKIVGDALLGADLSGMARQIERMLGVASPVAMRIAVFSFFVPAVARSLSNRNLRNLLRRVARASVGLEDYATQLMAERRAVYNMLRTDVDGAEQSHTSRDVLAMLLMAQANNGQPLPDDEIIAEIVSFMLVGSETSANTLVWSLILLAMYPEVRNRLEQEVDSVLRGRPPGAADASKMPWAAAVIAETLRLYPQAWTIDRTALTDDNIVDIKLPAGSYVAISPYLLHRNPMFWPDPAEFNPDRFMAGSTNAQFCKAAVDNLTRYSYLPFGGGRRACIGQAFAELESVVILASIVQRYRLEWVSTSIPSPVAHITLRHPAVVPMRLRRRS